MLVNEVTAACATSNCWGLSIMVCLPSMNVVMGQHVCWQSSDELIHVVHMQGLSKSGLCISAQPQRASFLLSGSRHCAVPPPFNLYCVKNQLAQLHDTSRAKADSTAAVAVPAAGAAAPVAMQVDSGRRHRLLRLV